MADPIHISHNDDRRLLLTCFAAVFGFGLAAHAYGFLNGAFSHDMLNALVADGVENYWKMQLGRPGIVLYRRLFRSAVAAPWQLGLLSLLWLSLSCFLTVKLLRVEGRLFPVLVGGLLTVSIPTIAMTATYLYEMDADLFAALLGVCAVFLWDRHGWKGALVGAVLTACCMGTYQSMISVPVTLAMLCCMAVLLRGRSFHDVFRKGLLAIAMLAAGVLLYWVGVRLMCAWKGINLALDGYNSVEQAASRSIPQRLADVYRTWAWAFWNPEKAHIEPVVLAVNLLLPLLALWRLVPWFIGSRTGPGADPDVDPAPHAVQSVGTSIRASGHSQASVHEGKTADCATRVGLPERLLFLLLLLLLPLGMNTAQLSFSRDVHDLMKYAFCFFPVFCLLPVFLLPTGRGTNDRRNPGLSRLLASCLVLAMLWSGIQTANVVYTRKGLEQDATLSLMTRVLARLEMQEDYIPGETPLVLVGVSAELQDRIPGFESTYDITGCEAASPIPKALATYSYNAYGAYFRYILNAPAAIADWTVWNRLQTDSRVEAMPVWPSDGCMQLLDGVMVIRMGEQDRPDA